MNYFISGNAGAGKSSVIATLRQRGFNAFDTEDMPEVTKKVVPKHKNGLAYSIVWDRLALEKLLDTDSDVFVGASVSNQTEFYPLFDKLFLLQVNEPTLEHRLATRTNNDTGKILKDRQFLISIHDRVQTNLLKAGAISIDATQPLETVVDDILSHCNEA